MVFQTVQESGPTEDHLCLSTRHERIEVVDDDGDLNDIEAFRGIQKIDSSSERILAFLREVPSLCQQKGQFGMIWGNHLTPSEGCYEPGEHYCSTREKAVKSVHSMVTFHRDGETGLKFAIKTLLSQDNFNPEEVKIGLADGHPNICSVYGILVRNGQIQIIMEHSGSPLIEHREWLRGDPERIIDAAKQCFSALAYLATFKLVHCDVKPDNITVVRNDDKFTLKLVDFGTCGHNGNKLPHSAHTTQEYWPPEVWQAVEHRMDIMLNPAFDVYAMALTLYFIETSCHLAQRMEDVKEVMLKEPGMIKMVALPDTLPADLRVVMKACLDESPQKRITAEQAVKRLQEKDDLLRPSCSSKPKSPQAFVSTHLPNYQESWQMLMQKVSQPGFSAARRADLVSVEKLKECYKSVSLGRRTPYTSVSVGPPATNPIFLPVQVPVKSGDSAVGTSAGTGHRAKVTIQQKHHLRVQKPRLKGKGSLKGPAKAKATAEKGISVDKSKSTMMSMGKVKNVRRASTSRHMEVEDEHRKEMDTSEYHCSNALKELAKRAKCSTHPQLDPVKDHPNIAKLPGLSPTIVRKAVAVQNAGLPPTQLEDPTAKQVFTTSVQYVVKQKEQAKVSSKPCEADIDVHPPAKMAKPKSKETQASGANEVSAHLDDVLILEQDPKEDIDYIVDVIDEKGLTGNNDLTDYLYQELLRLEQTSDTPGSAVERREEAMETDTPLMTEEPVLKHGNTEAHKVLAVQSVEKVKPVNQIEDVQIIDNPVAADSGGPKNLPDFSLI